MISIIDRLSTLDYIENHGYSKLSLDNAITVMNIIEKQKIHTTKKNGSSFKNFCFYLCTWRIEGDTLARTCSLNGKPC